MAFECRGWDGIKHWYDVLTLSPVFASWFACMRTWFDVVRMHANMVRMHVNVVRMHANVGDGLKNLALLDFSSVLADIVDVLAFDRRCQRLIRLFYFHEHEQPIAVDILNENTILKSRNAKFLRLSSVLACHRRRLNAWVRSPLKTSVYRASTHSITMDMRTVSSNCSDIGVTAFKVDRRGCLNKRQPRIPCNYWHFARPGGLWIVECIGPLWNMTLITPCPSLLVDDTDRAERDLLPTTTLE